MDHKGDTPSGENEPPDKELVARAQRGDPSAFDLLIVRYQKRLYSVIYNMTRQHDDTNDLMYESFAKAYQSLSGFKTDSSFYTWIYRIAVNRTINFLRQNKDKYRVSIDAGNDDGEVAFEIIDESATQDPHRQSEMQDLQKKLNESLMKLSEEHRAVVTLYDVEGLGHAEIGKILGCSEGTAKSRLFYAHKQLQKMMKGYIK